MGLVERLPSSSLDPVLKRTVNHILPTIDCLQERSCYGLQGVALVIYEMISYRHTAYSRRRLASHGSDNTRHALLEQSLANSWSHRPSPYQSHWNQTQRSLSGKTNATRIPVQEHPPYTAQTAPSLHHDHTDRLADQSWPSQACPHHLHKSLSLDPRHQDHRSLS